MKTPALVVDGITTVPFYNGTRECHAWNDVSVNTIEVEDETGKRRGAVAIALSKIGRRDGVVAFHAIEHAEAIVGLIQNAIADARRIEKGEATLAPIFDGTIERRDN